MTADSLHSRSSPLSPFHPLHNESTPKNYSRAYLEALNGFFENFDFIFREYFPKATLPEKAKKEEFEKRFQIWPDKIIDHHRGTEIPVPSKQDELIRAINSLFNYAFVKQEIAHPLELKEKQTETDSPLPLLPQTFTSLRQSVGASKKQLLSLPNEVLSIIFNFSVTDWQSVGKLALSCKTFYQLLQDPYHLHALFTSSSALFPSISHPDIGHKLFIQTEFHPSHFGFAQANWKDDDLNVLAKQGSHLKSLTLCGGQFSPETFAHLLKNCPQLESLEFRQWRSPCFDDYMTIVSLHATQLKDLKIIDCTMHDRALLALSVRAPQLRAFEYESSQGDHFLSDYGFISFFNRATQLESIKITGCLKVTQASLLTYIEKQSRSSGDDPQSQGIQLKCLKFSYCSVVGHRLFNALAECCPHLAKLELGFSRDQCIDHCNSKKQGLINLINACHHLRFLQLTDCSYFTSLHPLPSSQQDLQLTVINSSL